jgi:glycosyltransferase involved in cell wall biosynthesis
MRLTDLVTPLKPLEAMAQERLVVASDVGGHRELVEDGRTGILFRAGDAQALAAAVVAALSDPERARSIRRRGREFVLAERTWEKSVARYVPVYESLAGKGVRA